MIPIHCCIRRYDIAAFYSCLISHAKCIIFIHIHYIFYQRLIVRTLPLSMGPFGLNALAQCAIFEQCALWKNGNLLQRHLHAFA